ncbi:hypothetical protein MPOCJGCO_1311 [Methylobacterium trifolii]|uniref:Uncharacterized protein n=1 Tax=Methylobacterium trifolii TaxID=1003092 RepID=A0ABQ4TWZ8_9HYPH|nr:hypothetical protein MPOCJGCO_1311 [Methylobacterium trifolii]
MQLAVWLYGRSHTHEIGVRVAATCEGPSFHQVAGLVGKALYDLSRCPYAPPSSGARLAGGRRISLGGSQTETRAVA